MPDGAAGAVGPYAVGAAGPLPLGDRVPDPELGSGAALPVAVPAGAQSKTPPAFAGGVLLF